MSNEKLYNKIKLAKKHMNLTAVNIMEKYILTGELNGNFSIHEIKKKELVTISQIKLKSKIYKIYVPKIEKTAFVLAGSHIYYINLKDINNPKKDKLSELKDVEDFYLKVDDDKYKNMLLTLTSKGKIAIKIYEFNIEGDKIELSQKKSPKDLYIDKMPDYANWLEGNTFIYSYDKNKISWLNCDTGKKIKDDKFGDPIKDISNLFGKTVITFQVEDSYHSLFTENGEQCPLSPILHLTKHFCTLNTFDNYALALCAENITFYEQGAYLYQLIEQINFDKNEEGQFMAVSNNKLVVVTKTPDKHFNFYEIQGKTYEDKIKNMLDHKEFINALDTLVKDMEVETEEERKQKVEELHLDSAWVCLEGNKKDYETSIKYLSITNFNPFEFIYMYLDVLKIKIIHKDKENDIISNKKQNQIININDDEKKQKNELEYLVTILMKKRDYLENIIKTDKELLKSYIKFLSSKRGKINLESSTIKVTYEDTLYAINSNLIKSMIKLRADPQEIEEVLKNETIDYININDIKKEPFFEDEKIKNLDETKFVLSYIDEKIGDDYEKVLAQWKKFGESNKEKYRIIGKERTKKIFNAFNDTKDVNSEEKEQLFKKYIIWLLENFQEEAFEVITNTELVSDKIFTEEILTKLKSDKDVVKEQFLEYCNKNHKTEVYQTQLLQLYIDKLIKLTGEKNPPKILEGDAKKYYKLLKDIIESEDSVFNKKLISEDIENTWMKEIRLILLSQLKEFRKALEMLFEEAQEKKSFEEMEIFCNKNENNSDKKIYEIFYQLLSEEVKKYQNKINIMENKNEIEKYEEEKDFYENEMLKILKEKGKIDTIDPMFALNLANDNMNICQKKDFFNYLKKVVKDLTIEGNKYKIGKSISEIGLAYKIKEDYEIKSKYVTIDTDIVCVLCKQKISKVSSFVLYPNNNIYHQKCIHDINIDPLTGIDFSKTSYIG